MHRAFTAILLLALAQPSFAATQMQCMENVLQKLPRISHIKSGVVSVDGRPRPYIQYYYHASGPAWRSGNVRFIGNDAKTDATVTYVATINGLYTPGTEPADYGTKLVVDQWRVACKVVANVLSE
jgi:hypothetical protein